MRPTAPARVAQPTRLDMRASSARFAQLTPESLGAVLREAETGAIRSFADLCDRMIETDAEIRAALETRTATVTGSRRQVEPGYSGDPKRDAYAADCARFVERVVEDIKDIDQAAQNAMGGIAVGFAALQKIWAVDGDAVVVKELEWVHPRRFRFYDAWDLRLVDDGETYNVTGQTLDPNLWMIHQPATLPGYPTKSGVLRACAWPYLFKRWCHQFWNAGAERFAWPMLYAKVPRGADASVRAKALEGLETLSSDHAAVIEDPAAFTLLESTAKDNGTWKQLNEAMNAEIGKAILGMTDLSGPGKVGAYGAVESRRGATISARIALDERALASTFRSQLLEQIVRFNAHRWGGVVPPTPHLRWIISSSQTQIPNELISDASINERRASMNLDPVMGGDVVPSINKAQSAGPVSDAALTGAQVASLQSILSDVSNGLIASSAAIIAIANAFPTISSVDARTMVDAQDALYQRRLAGLVPTLPVP